MTSSINRSREAARQSKAWNLRIKISIDGGVSLQKNELVRTTFERYTDGRSTKRVWGVELESGEK